MMCGESFESSYTNNCLSVKTKSQSTSSRKTHTDRVVLVDAGPLTLVGLSWKPPPLLRIDLTERSKLSFKQPFNPLARLLSPLVNRVITEIDGKKHAFRFELKEIERLRQHLAGSARTPTPRTQALYAMGGER